ncbi:MAG: hypothetical protein ACRCT7_16260 [Shewanella sp.]
MKTRKSYSKEFTLDAMTLLREQNRGQKRLTTTTVPWFVSRLLMSHSDHKT